MALRVTVVVADRPVSPLSLLQDSWGGRGATAGGLPPVRGPRQHPPFGAQRVGERRR